MTGARTKRLIGVAGVLIAGVLGMFAWQRYGVDDRNAGLVSGNGRIEAVEVDVATKIAGRIADILVKEGDFVTAGQALSASAAIGAARAQVAAGDAAPQYVIPAEVSFVASEAQFTPKTVKTASEREKPMFRIQAQISVELLKKHIAQVKTGLPGMAYVRTDPNGAWPAHLQLMSPQ